MTTNPAPKHKRSITWVEPGNLLVSERSRAKVRPSVQVPLAAVVGAALAALLVAFASLRHGTPWLSRDALILILAIPAALAALVAKTWYLGRSIGLSETSMTIVHPGARHATVIAYRDMSGCTLTSHHGRKGRFHTLTISRDGGIDVELELPGGDLLTEVLAYLRDRGIAVMTSEAQHDR